MKRIDLHNLFGELLLMNETELHNLQDDIRTELNHKKIEIDQYVDIRESMSERSMKNTSLRSSLCGVRLYDVS